MNQGLAIFKKQLAGGGHQSALERQLWDKYGVMPPEAEMYPDFYKLRRELEFDPLMAARGESDVPHLQEGTERFMGPGAGDPRTASTSIGAWGDTLGPWSLAVSPADIASGKYYYGERVMTPYGPKIVQDKSYVSPGNPNPSGTMEYWLPSGSSTPTYGVAGSGQAGVKAGGKEGIAPATGRRSGPYRDLSTPTGPLGMGTRFFETPESEFPRATPGPSFTPNGSSPSGGEVPQGQVSVPGDNIGYAPGTYTGTLGGPGDPGGSGGQQLQLSNQLGYNPSYPYGSFGSGSLTRSGFGVGGGLLGGAAGNLLIPGLGGIIGNQVGGKFGSWLGKLFNNWRMNQGQGQGGDGGGDGGVRVGDPQVVEMADGGGGGGGLKGLNFGNMFSGLPEGFSEIGRFGQGAPTFTGPGGSGSWIGGSAFGHPVGNFATAIGFGGPFGASGPASYGGGWGNSLARGQMLRAMKGIGTGMGAGSGYSPLYSLTGSAAPSSGQLQQSQADLGAILRANPQLLVGATSGAVPRGTPMKQSVQKGSSDIMQTTGNNSGLRLFMAMQGQRRKKPK